MACDVRAMLLVTRQIEGTSTSVARQRIELCCSQLLGHNGPHRDNAHDQEWQVVEGRPTLLLRHENEQEKNQ
jgi:hypothetical protein